MLLTPNAAVNAKSCITVVCETVYCNTFSELSPALHHMLVVWALGRDKLLCMLRLHICVTWRTSTRKS